MKNLDVKKLLVLILIIALIGILIFFIARGISKSKLTDDEKKEIENKIVTYYASMTYGFNTTYNGLDVLYNSDSIVYDDLSTASILTVASKYSSNKGYTTGVSDIVINKLKENSEYGDLSSASFYNGEELRKAIKELFGVNFENSSANNNYDFIYDYIYNSEYDIYIVKNNNVPTYSTGKEYIDYSIIETKRDKDTIKTTIAIAYVYNDGTSTNYYKDKNGEELIVENVKEFPTDKIDEFDKYTFTLTLGENNNYVFKSVEKTN